MTRFDVGQKLTILANIGVIAGIVFLGYEVRQNTATLKSAGAQNIYNQIAAINELRMNPEYVTVIQKGNERPGDLSSVERVQYYAYVSNVLHAWQNMYVQMREGAYPEESLDGWWQVLRENFQWPGFTEYWEVNGYVLSPDFRAFVATDVLSREPSDSYVERFQAESLQ